MRILYTIEDIVEEELKAISKKDELSETDLENVYKIVDIIKDITTIEAMEHSEHERGGKHYSRNRDGEYDYYRDRYNSNDDTKEKLERLMHKAGTEQERESIRRIIEQM